MGNAGYLGLFLILYFILNSIFTTSTRLTVRIYYSHYYQDSNFKKIKKEKRLLLIGAGKTGDKIAREILARNQYTT